MEAPPAIAIDFETHPIESRPHYPPHPVGVSIKWPGQPSHYYAVSHATGGNNATPEQAHAALRAAWKSDLPLLFHNAGFDVAVACERLGLPWPDPLRVHDTLFLAYLHNPHQKIALKPLAERLLGWPPEERDDVAGWLWEHRRQLETSFGVKVTSAQKAGKWIAYAPGDVVAPYARGDTDRTAALFELLWPEIQRTGMGAAYDRERLVLPIFLENERVGLRVDVAGLTRDVDLYARDLETAEQWLRVRLGASGLNFDSDRDVSSVLLQRGIVAAEDWSYTQSGELSMSKEALKPAMFRDPQIASALGYRNRLVTCLNTFMRGWLAQATAGDGRIHPHWNQVASERGGTRTGRPSCDDPNLLNIAKNFESKGDGYVHPNFLPVQRLPLVRRYVLPDEGHIWGDIDFSGQEMRGFAHFEQGELWQAYHDDPDLDPHLWVKAAIKEAVGFDLERTRVKNVSFARLYGGGEPAVYAQARCSSRAEARQIMAYHDRALPGRRMVDNVCKALARRNEPIVTWGGRRYYCEPPSMSKKHGRHMSYEYKLINYLIQGSAADVTKQAMVDWQADGRRNARFLAQVYDEMCISMPFDDARRQMHILREVMEAPRFDVPMRTDSEWGPSWGELEKFTEERLPWAA